MPRRSPKAVRAERWRPRWQCPVLRVHGVAARTRAAIRRVEDQEMWPNAVADALSRIEWVFAQPGRYLDASVFCSPGTNDARDDLEWAMWRLPPGANQDLGRLITRIDEELGSVRRIRARAAGRYESSAFVTVPSVVHQMVRTRVHRTRMPDGCGYGRSRRPTGGDTGRVPHAPGPSRPSTPVRSAPGRLPRSGHGFCWS